VHEAARRLHAATEGIERLMRRKKFIRELHERGNWLANGPADPPEWVRKWSAYWGGLKSDPAYVRLQKGAAEAHGALHTPEFESALDGLKHGDASGAEYAVAYLEADPWYFRSGYLKGRIARWLRQVELSETQQARLRVVLIAALQKGSRYEQVEYRKLARRLDTPGLRAELSKLARSKDEGISRRATLMLRFCELNDMPGRDLRGAR
jgi:hypothetical protein